MRVLRARRPVAAAQDGRAGEVHAQSRADHPRHRAHHARRAQQSLQPGGRRRAREQGEKVYDTIIPRNVRVSEAPSYGKPVLVYDLKCVGSEAYLRLATEIIQREKELRAALPRPTARRRWQHPDAARSGAAMTRAQERRPWPDDGRSRLGRGLAALIGDVGAEADRDRARAQPAPRADRISQAQSAQPAPQLLRRRARRAGRLDPRARHHPADRGAAGARQRRSLRDHRRRAALARGAARRPARGADRRARGRATARRSSSPSSRTCSAPISIRSKRRRAIRRWSTSISTARRTSPRSSARAAATSPTRCGC